MKPNIVTSLDSEDLTRYRLACAKREMVEFSVGGVGKDEAQGILFDWYRILGDIATKYNLNLDTEYVISPVTGAILTE